MIRKTTIITDPIQTARLRLQIVDKPAGQT